MELSQIFQAGLGVGGFLSLGGFMRTGPGSRRRLRTKAEVQYDNDVEKSYRRHRVQYALETWRELMEELENHNRRVEELDKGSLPPGP